MPLIQKSGWRNTSQAIRGWLFENGLTEWDQLSAFDKLTRESTQVGSPALPLASTPHGRQVGGGG